MGEVDVPACAPRVRGINDRTLSLALRVEAFDHDESEGSMVEWVDADGIGRHEWMLASPQPGRLARRARWELPDDLQHRRLRQLERASTNPRVRFVATPGADHFSGLTVANRAIAAEIMADTGATTNLTLGSQDVGTR